jgi:hypothetical protein
MSDDTKWTKVGGPCVPWSGAVDDDGYGRVSMDGKWRRAHRVAYEKSFGPIASGLVIDHLCRNRLCVNPLHMEPVTNAENILRGDGATARNKRKSVCKRGHPFTGSTHGGRMCKTCRREMRKQARAKRIADGTWQWS